jgi:hypothetical protein
MKFSVYSEFQNLKSIALGNINTNDQMLSTLPVVAGKSHKQGLVKLFNDTRDDLTKIQNILEQNSVEVIRSGTYNTNQIPSQSLPLSARDWFLIYGQDVLIPHPFYSCHQMRSRSLDRIFDCTNNVMRWQGDTAEFQPRQDTIDVPLVYFDSANFLRCGKHILYSHNYNGHGSKKGLQEITRFLQDRHSDLTFVPVDEYGHLDGSLFLVRPGLLMTTNHSLPSIFDKWDKILVDPLKNKFAERNKLRYKKFHPLLIKEWQWFKETNPEETAFTVNALSINESKVLFPGFDKDVFNKLEKKGVECVNLDLQTCDFWDAGLHCLTNEIHREGPCLNYF